jgi:Co/Zn/Cd efflux system component
VKCIAFASFIGFATVQTVVALLAKSQAMIGDSAAMAVDALAYGFNLLAEREKHVDDLEAELSAATMEGDTNITPLELESAKAEKRLRHRRRQLQLELVPPLISVSVLLIVVGYVLNDAIRTLVLDVNRSETEQSRPNIILMMTFSTLNLLVDVMNVMCFARANHLTGYNTVEKQPIGECNNEIDDNERLIERYATHFEIQGGNERKAESSHINTSSEDVMSGEQDEDERVNLNMCSAYTVSFCLCLCIDSTARLTVSSLTHSLSLFIIICLSTQYSMYLQILYEVFLL